MQALISDIKHFAVHDGEGIRTTVFLKGCPLKCVWCHNPEGLGFEPQVAYYKEKCINCGECESVCRAKAQKTEKGIHIFNRSLCVGCGECAKVCLGGALNFYGKRVTVEELMPILLEDREFYDNSGGGVTLSGGECLMQPDFCAELLKALKKEGINTAVDTSGFVPKSAFDKVVDYTDTFLYDIKALDRDVHKKCTGEYNDIILENLEYLDSKGKKIEIRIPFVPKFNDDQIEKIAEYVKTLKSVTAVKILPFHNFAGNKYLSLGYENNLPDVLPSEEQLKKAESFFR